MTNSKISLKEAYDNRDVIAQIVDLRTEAGEATDASANAVATSNHAATLAGNAVDTANAASAVANGIDAKATQALEKSAEAVTASHKAEGTADAASAVADAAAATANGIDAKAQSALDTSADAMTEASEASAKALAVDKKVDASNVRIGALEQTEGQHDARISTLQRDLNNVKAEYLDKFDLTGTQLIRSRTDFEKEPLIHTVSPGDVDKDGGRHAVNYAAMKRDALMLEGNQISPAEKTFARLFTTNRFLTDDYYQHANLFAISEIIAETTFAIPGATFLHGGNVIVGAIAYSNVQFGNPDVTINGMFIGPGAFENSNVSKVTITNPLHTFINYNAFQNCKSLKTIRIKKFAGTGPSMINCSSLTAFIIEDISNDKIPELTTPDAFNGTPIRTGTGFIYVPDALVDDFKSATNWIVYASQIKPLSQLPAEASA